MAVNQRSRHYNVWSTRGGHGGTTIAGALGRLWGVPIRGDAEGELEWVFGPREQAIPSNGVSVTDAGIIRSDTPVTCKNLVVLRGPSAIGVRTLSSAVTSIDHLVVIREPWRRITNPDVEDVLGVPVAAEVAFSERVSQLADAGLLGVRLHKLEEFAELRCWAATRMCVARSTGLARQQVTRHTR